MPVYQYACTECGHQLEVRQSFTDEPLSECPACAGRLRKVLNAVGVVFKGSGFYRTDSRADNGKAGAGAAASSSEGTSSEASSNGSGAKDGGAGSKNGNAGSGSSSGSGSKPASTSAASS